MDDESRTGPTAPHSLEAEREVIASVLLNEEHLDALSERVRPEDFYIERYRIIWESFGRLRKAKIPIDTVTVAESIRGEGKLDKIGGVRSISETIDRGGLSANCLHYAATVQAKAALRKLLDTARAIEVRALGDMHQTEVPEFFAEAERDIGVALKEARRLTPGESWSAVTISNVERAFKPPEIVEVIRTGIHRFDAYLPAGGFEPGWLVIGMAPPGVGKTTFALGNPSREALLEDKGVVYFSAEMRAPRLNIRMLAGESGVSTRALKRGDMTSDQRERWSEAGDRIAAWPLQVEPVKGVDEIAATLRAARDNGVGPRKRPLRFGVVDYVQRVRNGYKNRFEDIEYTMNTLQSLALELEIPILALSQPSTDARRTKKALSAADAKGSGSIEEDCDLLIILERGVNDRDAAGINIDKGREVSPMYWPAEDCTVGKRELTACGWRWDERYMRMVGDG